MKIKKLLSIALLSNTSAMYAGLNDTGITTCSNETQNGSCAVSSLAMPPDKSKVTTALANIAIPFEENRGQANAKVAFQAKTLAGPLFVTKDGELVL